MAASEAAGLHAEVERLKREEDMDLDGGAAVPAPPGLPGRLAAALGRAAAAGVDPGLLQELAAEAMGALGRGAPAAAVGVGGGAEVTASAAGAAAAGQPVAGAAASGPAPVPPPGIPVAPAPAEVCPRAARAAMAGLFARGAARVRVAAADEEREAGLAGAPPVGAAVAFSAGPEGAGEDSADSPPGRQRSRSR